LPLGKANEFVLRSLAASVPGFASEEQINLLFSRLSRMFPLSRAKTPASEMQKKFAFLSAYSYFCKIF